jgi:catechol 2,3-dioxygenase-like lactoylglutathione lyase family enzyme
MDRKLFELVLVVKTVEAAARFYRDAVGLEPIGVASDEWAGFWVGERETNAWLGLRRGKLLYEEFSKLPEGSRFGPAHFALRVPVEKKPEALLRLARHAVTVYGPEVWEPGRFEGESYYFYDPDDNLVEFWFPCR